MPSLAAFLPVRSVYLQITLLELFMYGIYSVLFFATISAFIFKPKLAAKHIRLYPAVFAMYILSSIHAALRWLLIKRAFIDHGDSPLETISYLFVAPLWIETLSAVVFTTNTLLADSILIWRCWTVWARDWRVVVIPILSTIAGAVLGYMSVEEQARYTLHPNLDRGAFIDFATPYCGLSLATTLLCTLLIIFRIVWVTRMAKNTLRGYGLVIEMVVESAVLYSATVTAYLIFLLSHTFNDGYPQAIVAQMTGIAPTLIVARVSLGLSRPAESWHSKAQPEVTTLLFASQSAAQPSSTILHLSGPGITGDKGESTENLE